MFESLLEELNDLETARQSTSEFLRKLNGARTRLRNSIVNSEAEVKKMQNEKNYVAEVKEQLKKDALSAAKNILSGKILQAIKNNYEFDSPPYRNGLLEAARNNDTFLIRSKGSGFNSIISVDINLDKSAGRLNRWAAGIKAYRKVLDQYKKEKQEEAAKAKGKKVKHKKYDPIAASRGWAGIFKRREGTWSEFSSTIRERLALSGAVAPFWQILDKGKIPLQSDRGGYPTPENVPTNFVKESEDAVNAYLKKQLELAKEKFNNLFSDYQKFLDEANAKLAHFDNMANEIRLDIKVVRKLERQLGLEKEDISRNKLEKQVELIRKGLVTKGRINIGPSGKTKNLSVEKIKDLLY